MATFAEVAKYLIPALSGVAGAIQPKTADALQDIVSMREAFKDKERTYRRQDEADEMARQREKRAVTSFDAAQAEYGRAEEDRKKNDAMISGMMRNLPSRFSEDPRVLAFANAGDISGMMEYIEGETRKTGMQAGLQTMLADKVGQGLSPNQYESLAPLAETAPSMLGPMIQAAAGVAGRDADPLLAVGDLGGVSVPPNASVSVPVDLGGGVEGRSTLYGSPRTSSTSTKSWEDPVYVQRTTSNWVNRANELYAEYDALRSGTLSGKTDSSKKKAGEARAKKLEKIKADYIKERNSYQDEARKFPGAYVAPTPTWDQLMGSGGISFQFPEDGGGKKKEPKDDATVSDSDKPTGVNPKEARYRQLKGKKEAGETLSDDEQVELYDLEYEYGSE